MINVEMNEWTVGKRDAYPVLNQLQGFLSLSVQRPVCLQQYA